MISKMYAKVKSFIKENYVFILVLIGINVLFYVELPYIIEVPGGSISLNDRVLVEDGYELNGEMGMAYVSVVRGSIPFLLASFVLPNWDIVPASEVKYENETMDEARLRDKIYLQEAVDTATIVALRRANKSVEITKVNGYISYIAPGAESDLRIGDLIVSVEGKRVSNVDDIKEIVDTKSEGDSVEFLVERDGKEVKALAQVFSTDAGLKVGISLITTYDYESDTDVSVEFKNSESGPSGGMMTALMIYDMLVSEDLTKGRKVIGTGTIDLDGGVGVIGGVKYKLAGAIKNGADVFLCPMDNLSEALEVKKDNDYDIEVVGVATLDDAIAYLRG